VPSGLNPGDYIYLSSNAVFDAGETFCTLGENLRVYGISGNTIYLNSPVTGPFTYHTSNNASIQKITFLAGNKLENIEWVCATPESITAGGATPATQVVSAGSGNGFNFKRCIAPEISRVKATGHSGTFINLTNCIRFRVTECDFKDSASSPNGAGAYGYAISSYGSQWGIVQGGSVDNGHGFFNAEGTGQVAGDIVMPSYHIEVRDVVSRNGVNEPYLCHNSSAFIDFISCKVIGGPSLPPEASHGSGFHNLGHYCRIIDPICSNVTGAPIALGGDHCEVIRPVIRDVQPWGAGAGGGVACGIKVNGTNCKIIEPDIDGVPFSSGFGSGMGIWILSGATGCEITKGTIRNTSGDAVHIDDTSDTCVIDRLTGINIGTSGGTFYVIYTAASNPAAQWSSIRAINCPHGITNHSSGLIANLPSSATSIITTSNASWPIPTGANYLEITCIGGGGGGGGGGSSSAIANQVGGSGGASGMSTTQVVAVGTNTTLNVTVGAGGGGGSGGASGGNAGNDGSAAGSSSVGGTGISCFASTGGRGLGGGANSSATKSGFQWGSFSAGGGASNAAVGGGGGASSSAGVAGGSAVGYVGGGGQGGNPTSATNGGTGGAAGSQTADTPNGSAGGSGTTAGTNGSNAASNTGAGGGGGGGGAWNGGTGPGAGGTGGTGGSGLVIIKVVG
jgi:hypothetical protein